MCVAVVTSLNFGITMVFVIRQKANPAGVIFVHNFLTVCWLGLLAYGIFLWHDQKVNDCWNFAAYGCAEWIIQFVFFILTGLELYALFPIPYIINQ